MSANREHMSRIGRLGGKTSAGRRQSNVAGGIGNESENGRIAAPEPGQTERTLHEGPPEPESGAPPASQSM